jgi:hypothetical protein
MPNAIIQNKIEFKPQPTTCHSEKRIYRAEESRLDSINQLPYTLSLRS